MNAVMQMIPASANSLAVSPDAPDVLLAVFGGEAQIGAKPVAHVVAVQHIDMLAEIKQLALQVGGDGGFARSRQAGQPDDAAVMAVARGALAGGHFARLQKMLWLFCRLSAVRRG